MDSSCHNGKEEQKMNNENEKILPENLELNLSDFALFLSVMKHKAAYECAVSIILDEQDIEIRQVKVEQVVLNKSGKRAIRLDAIVSEVKQSEEWEEVKMSILEIGLQKGMEQGMEQGKLEVARNLLDVLSDEVISQKVGLDIETVRRIRRTEEASAENKNELPE